MYLLDTNVVSELRRSRPHKAVLRWLETIPPVDVHLSSVSIGEIQRGIELTRKQDRAKAAEIEEWLQGLAQAINVLPMDVREFRWWARFMHNRSDDLIEDAMIAATAQVHDLTVATRNVKDFRPFGVRTFDPFSTSSG